MPFVAEQVALASGCIGSCNSSDALPTVVCPFAEHAGQSSIALSIDFWFPGCLESIGCVVAFVRLQFCC